ncbi:cell-cycle control medial ring component [Aspergillus granulosus]|uniref:Cell-cycle control medial ring component n=1 Tax=Aspergillus granulosus TaxID=176169 RepID=A0ABR4H3U3_9EURO
MSELAFAKTFLSALDSRPVKLRPDYVHEQETPRAPYLLPRLQPPRPEMPKKTKTPAVPGSSKSISITLKSARNPVLEFTIPNAPLSTTTISDLKDAVRERTLETSSENKVALDKVKILYKRKPVTGTGKTVGEVLTDAGEGAEKEVEFGVMIMGGARVVAAEGQKQGEGQQDGSETTVKAAVGPSGEEVLVTEQFWDDLQGYLGQRLKDEELAKRLRGIFGDAWAATR